MPEVDVIVPIYNTEEYRSACLEALPVQTILQSMSADGHLKQIRTLNFRRVVLTEYQASMISFRCNHYLFQGMVGFRGEEFSRAQQIERED